MGGGSTAGLRGSWESVGPSCLSLPTYATFCAPSSACVLPSPAYAGAQSFSELLLLTSIGLRAPGLGSQLLPVKGLCAFFPCLTWW